MKVAHASAPPRAVRDEATGTIRGGEHLGQLQEGHARLLERMSNSVCRTLRPAYPTELGCPLPKKWCTARLGDPATIQSGQA